MWNQALLVFCSDCTAGSLPPQARGTAGFTAFRLDLVLAHYSTLRTDPVSKFDEPGWMARLVNPQHSSGQSGTLQHRSRPQAAVAE